MLATIALLAMSLSGLHAQYTPVPYNFQKQPASGGTGTSDGSMLDDGLFSINDLAANGYGEWAVSSGNSDGLQWMLFGDTLTDASVSNSNLPIASGLIAYGPIPNGSNPNAIVKVVTNLNGSVRFVMNNANGFSIYGLDAKNIGISMASIPYPSNSRSVIKRPAPTSDPNARELIYYFTTLDPTIQGNGLDMASGDDHDVWGIAMDSKYLYITWQALDGNIYVDAIDLSASSGTGAEVSGWPQIVLAGCHGPSIACDVRNAPSGPTFDAAGIKYSGSSAEIDYEWYLNGSASSLLHFQPVVNFSSTCYFGEGDGYTLERAKVLVSSVSQVDETHPHATAKAFYITRQSSGACDLLFQRLYNSTSNNASPQPNTLDGIANYVDGNSLRSNRPATVPESDEDDANPAYGPLYYYVADEPLIAFSNPYDAQSSYITTESGIPFGEFHCCYRIADQYSTEDDHAHYYDEVTSPWIIVRCDQDGCWGTDTRTVLNRQSTDNGTTWSLIGTSPQQRTVAVNQMGIHAHWSDEFDYYTRDTRRFDEPIEENTLATYDCPVGDGTSHGGTQGATLAGGDTLCVWTDPFIGVTSTPPNNGIYASNAFQPLIWQNGRLRLVDANISLNIGSSTIGALPGHFVMMPNALMEFNNSGQSLQINSGSTFDYFGLPNADGVIGSPHFTNFLGLNGSQTFAINLVGSGNVYCPDETSNDAPCSLVAQATLNVHGGAVFELSSLCTFSATNAVLNSNFEPSIVPAYSSTGNASTSGLLKFDCPVSLTDSYVYSGIPSGTIPIGANYFMRIQPGQTTATTFVSSPIASQFTATNCLFQNNATSPGDAIVEFTGTMSMATTYGTSLINGGRCEATQLFFDNPYEYVTVENMYFDKIQSNGVRMYEHNTSGYAATSYSTMSIAGNIFQTFASGAYGIVLQGFGENSFMSVVQAEYNDFSTATSDGSTQAAAAISAQGSSAVIMGNVITGAGYNHGILNQGAGVGGLSNSLICRNTVENTYYSGNGAGLVTNNWGGISKLNDLMYDDIGHQSGVNDIGSVMFSRYAYNRGAGLQTTTSSTVVHMDGGHAGSDDYGAFDTLDHNGTATSTTHAEIESAGSTLVLGETGTGTGTTFGRNNFISANSPNGLFLLNTSGTTDMSAGVAENYWATDYSGLWSLTTITLTGTTNSHIDNGSTSYPSSLACDGSINIPGYSVYCGIGFDVRAEKGKNSFLPLENGVNDCAALFKSADNLRMEQQYAQSYDTAKAYIQGCANVGHSYSGFNVTGQDVSFMSNDNMRWLDYREWLKSVLYLDTTSEAQTYYCSDADAIVSTFAYIGPNGKDYNGAVAVIDYLLKSGKCLMDSTSLWEYRRSARDDQYQNWFDSLQENLHPKPIDSTEPNIDDLGLSLLRGKPSSVSMEPLRSKHNILSFGATESPFRDETQLYFELSQPVALRIDLLDVLGREVGHPSTGQLFAPGMHYAAIFGNDLPAGTLYARLTAANGEVRTLKLVKLQ